MAFNEVKFATKTLSETRQANIHKLFFSAINSKNASHLQGKVDEFNAALKVKMVRLVKLTHLNEKRELRTCIHIFHPGQSCSQCLCSLPIERHATAEMSTDTFDLTPHQIEAATQTEHVKVHNRSIATDTVTYVDAAVQTEAPPPCLPEPPIINSPLEISLPSPSCGSPDFQEGKLPPIRVRTQPVALNYIPNKSSNLREKLHLKSGSIPAYRSFSSAKLPPLKTVSQFKVITKKDPLS
ncbi:hypothetical protein [Parashewanella tropica]|uniref:hypothetical protein n=1 Tax=Parashewanella tropica TaxID=2547970 RepID=UPI00105A49D5|nr:hypothetical protein [Parashewanella tropica]